MFSNLARDLHGLLSTRRELARAEFIATLRRSPSRGQQHFSAQNRGAGLDQENAERESSGALSGRVTPDQEQHLIVVPQGRVLVFWGHCADGGARLANEVEFHIRTNMGRRMDD